jgi:ABC-2 type transport system permease protein
MFERRIKWINDLFFIWRQEMEQVFKDEGVLIFFVIVPLIYPLLYSWIYNNETVHEVPVAIVDQCHTSLSRQFVRMCDASPDVHVAYYAQDLDEAKSLVSRQLVKGIYLIPSDFDDNVNRMQQATVSVYCDMSLMLTYKAIFQTAQLVSMKMGEEIQTKLGGHFTSREEAIAARPLNYAEVAIFNPQGGYGSFILPGVLMLILQQTLVLGIGLSAGTARETNRYHQLIPISRPYQNIFRIVFGKSLCYFMIYALMGVWLVVVVPRLFHFPQLATWRPLLLLMLPYLLACIFFGMVVSCLVRYRENVMLLMVFVSVPLLFMSGVSWPGNNIPGFWQGVSWVFPSTFGIKGYVRLNSMGASLSDISTELHVLWLHAFLYFWLACVVYGYQIYLTRQDAIWRIYEMKKRKKHAG